MSHCTRLQSSAIECNEFGEKTRWSESFSRISQGEGEGSQKDILRICDKTKRMRNQRRKTRKRNNLMR